MLTSASLHHLAHPASWPPRFEHGRSDPRLKRAIPYRQAERAWAGAGTPQVEESGMNDDKAAWGPWSRGVPGALGTSAPLGSCHIFRQSPHIEPGGSRHEKMVVCHPQEIIPSYPNATAPAGAPSAPSPARTPSTPLPPLKARAGRPFRGYRGHPSIQIERSDFNLRWDTA